MLTGFITFDPGAIAGIISNGLTSAASFAAIAGLLYAIGGILIRTVSWTFDNLLINLIASFYKYFETIINGTLLSDGVVREMMNRIYLIVGVFVAFRLGMLLFNYILNPSEVMDEKLGVNSLIKRIILGLILILFMPNIFGFAFRLQEAIFNDQIIESIIMPEDKMLELEEYKGKHGMGKILGMTVFNGFFSLSPTGANSASVREAYDKATNIKREYDLSVINDVGFALDSGILNEIGGEYSFDYFPIFSTVVLCYVLYLLVQYCLDAVVRSFKLSVLQVIAPVCIVEYMINGDRNEVFKSWRKAVISTFAMLFMRVASLWFVAYVTMLMQPGATDSNSLLQTQDNLLKAIIVLGLLAFMMDFPKMMSDVFGLDLDQSSSVKNVMGKAMGAATAGLAIGGAAVGLGMKAAGSGAKTLKGGMANLAKKDSSFAKGLKNPFKTGAGMLGIKPSKAGSAFATAAKENKLGTTLKSGAIAVGAAALASNSVTKSAASGYQQTTGAVDNKVKGLEAKDVEQARHDQIIDLQSRGLKNQAFETDVNIAANIKAQNPTISTVDLPQAIIDAKINANASTVATQTADLEGKLKLAVDSTGNINDQYQATQIVKTQMQEDGFSTETINKVVNQVETIYSGGGSISDRDAQSLIKQGYEHEYRPTAEKAAAVVNPNIAKP